MTELRHLVVVVPGMGGSVLRDPAQPDRQGPAGRDLVWYGHRRALVRALVEPDHLALERTLEPVGLLDGFGVVPWFKNIAGYGPLWSMVRDVFPSASCCAGDPRSPNPNATIVAFPYDFRLGVEHASDRLAAMITARVATLGEATRVIVVAHSMGGLVARHWVAHHDGRGRCRGLITLGTPHGGAPKALDVLVNGLYWRSRHVQRHALSAVVQAWPGLHDLVGTEARMVDERSGLWCRPHEVPDLPVAGLLGGPASMHGAIRDWWADVDRERRPSLIPFAGRGHGTLSSTTWDGSGLRRRGERLEGEPQGDATVPYWSATPGEWSRDVATSGVRACEDRHGVLVAPAGLRGALLALNGVDPPPDRGNEGCTPRLGLALEDVIGPGEILEGTVLFGDEPFGVSAGGVSAVLLDDSGDDPGDNSGATLPLAVEDEGEGRFRVEVPDQAVGDVVVTVGWYRTATDERLVTSERVAVVA